MGDTCAPWRSAHDDESRHSGGQLRGGDVSLLLHVRQSHRALRWQPLLQRGRWHLDYHLCFVCLLKDRHVYAPRTTGSRRQDDLPSTSVAIATDKSITTNTKNNLPAIFIAVLQCNRRAKLEPDLLCCRSVSISGAEAGRGCEFV